jgi:hypothetical protein
MEVIEKYSVTPFSLGSIGGNELDLPFSLGDVRIESVKGLLRSEHFSIWKNFISEDSIERFQRAEVALVHQFRSGFVVGRDEEDSKNLLHKAFVCLRLVKPTRAAFSVAQYRKTKDGDLDVFSASWPTDVPLILPESEVLNQINANDLHQLKTLWPRFKDLRDSGPGYLRRATRYYETAYAELRELDLQFVTWVAGIEALYTQGEEPSPLSVIKERILESLGPVTDIYSDFERRSHYAPNPVFVKDVLDNMFELRNRFIHGAWAPKSWLDRPMRRAISGGTLALPDVLREAASFILRAGLKKLLSEM